MKFYIKFKKDGAYLHGQAPNQRRCDLVTTDGRRYEHSVGFIAGQHTAEEADEAAAATALGLVAYGPPTPTAREALAAAYKSGLEVTTTAGTFRLKCGESDRSAFTQRATLFLTAQEFMTSTQKTAHRATTTVIVDADDASHTITVGQFQQLILAYGTAFDALWTAAAAE